MLSTTDIFVFSKMLSNLAVVGQNEEINVNIKFPTFALTELKHTAMKHLLASMEKIPSIDEFFTEGTSKLFPADCIRFFIAQFSPNVDIRLT